MSLMRRHHRGRAGRPRVGWLVLLYVLGLGSSALHMAVAEHHAHPLHGDNQGCAGATADHAATVSGSSFLGTEADDHCCHQLHDALPGKSQAPALDALKNAASRRAPALLAAVAPPPPARPDPAAQDHAPLAACAGVTTVAAGRAPPTHLHA